MSYDAKNYAENPGDEQLREDDSPAKLARELNHSFSYRTKQEQFESAAIVLACLMIGLGILIGLLIRDCLSSSGH